MAGVALLGVSAAKPANERIVTGDGIVEVTINGVGGRMRIEPAGTGMPLIENGWAVRAGLKPGMIAIGYGIGSTIVRSRSGVGRIDLGSGAEKHRIAWTERRFTQSADGIVGPGGVPEPVVRFVLRPPLVGERTVTLPMIDQGGLFGGWFDRYAVIDLAGTPLRLRFDPHHPRTLATAGAGVRLAAAFNGRMEGAATAQEIAFGIERPVRTLALERPFSIGPLSIRRLGVRTSDYGSATGIADADAPAAGVDPNEIVVIGKGKKRNTDNDQLTLGADVLGQCSQIVFDKPAKTVRLSCK